MNLPISDTWQLAREFLTVVREYLVFAFALLGGILSIRNAVSWWNEFHEKRVDSFKSVERNALKLVDKIVADHFQPKLVIGIGRSGAFLGGWLAGNIGPLPIAVIDRVFSDSEGRGVHYPDAREQLEFLKSQHGDAVAVLVVEGASTTGSTLKEFAEIRKQIVPGWDCKYAVIYKVETCSFPTNYVAVRLKRAPKRYPWHKTVGYQGGSHLPGSRALHVL